ncbi:MAG: PilZ domain-containing protein, partial [Planctomycetota bacterium]
MASPFNMKTKALETVSRKFAPMQKSGFNFAIVAGLIGLLVLLLVIRKIISVHEKQLADKASWQHLRQLCREKEVDEALVGRLIAILKDQKLANPDRAITSSEVFEAMVMPTLTHQVEKEVCDDLYTQLFLKTPPQSVRSAQKGRGAGGRSGRGRQTNLADLLPEEPPERRETVAAGKDEAGLHRAVPETAASVAAAQAKREDEPKDEPAPSVPATPSSPEPSTTPQDDLMVQDDGYSPEGTAELLQAGMDLRTRFPGSQDFHLCPVLHSSWEGFTIALPEYLRGQIKPKVEDPVSCHIAVKQACFHFETRIQELVGGGFHICRLSHASGLMKVERRRTIRLDVNMPLHFFHFTDDIFASKQMRRNAEEAGDKVMRKGILLDLSLDGCGMRPIGNTRDIEVGHFLRFQLAVSGEK